jgi:hypothetical protein
VRQWLEVPSGFDQVGRVIVTEELEPSGVATLAQWTSRRSVSSASLAVNCA